MSENLNNPVEIKTCPRCHQPFFTKGERAWMPDICIGRGGCCPRMTCCNDETCKNRRYYEFYMMTHRRNKIINIKQAARKI